jgi:hypothetical protein
VKQILLFLAKLLLISLLLYVFKDVFMQGYEFVVLWLYSVFTHRSPAQLQTYYDSAFRVIPYAALVLATPRINWRRRSTFMVAGIGMFMFFDLLSTIIWQGPPPHDSRVANCSPSHILYSLVWETVGHWVLPILLWLGMAYKEIRNLLE